MKNTAIVLVVLGFVAFAVWYYFRAGRITKGTVGTVGTPPIATGGTPASGGRNLSLQDGVAIGACVAGSAAYTGGSTLPLCGLAPTIVNKTQSFLSSPAGALVLPPLALGSATIDLGKTAVSGVKKLFGI